MNRMLRAALFCALVLVPAGAHAQTDSVFAVSRLGVSLLRVNVDGNVGIGTSSPGQRLTVIGGIRADSVLVTRIRFDDGSSLSSTSITTFTPTFEPDWSIFTQGGFAEARYYKDLSGIVHLEGLVWYQGSSSPSTAFYLPAGYRPNASHVALALNLQNSQPVQVVINPDGAVRIFPLSGGTIAQALVSLTGVQFLP
jgi:hypothetical protein